MSELPKARAVIPAWSGSKRVPNKNWRPFSRDDESLADVAMGFALACPWIEDWCLSTDARCGHRSDMRNRWLVSDKHNGESSGTLAVWQEAVETCWPDFDGPVLLLEPNSPLRTFEDVRQCIAAYTRTGRGGFTTSSYSPGKIMTPQGFVPIPKDLSAPNGAVWIVGARELAAQQGKFGRVHIGFRPNIDTMPEFRVWSEFASRLMENGWGWWWESKLG